MSCNSKKKKENFRMTPGFGFLSITVERTKDRKHEEKLIYRGNNELSYRLDKFEIFVEYP